MDTSRTESPQQHPESAPASSASTSSRRVGRRYQMKLFVISMLGLWSIIGVFTGLIFYNVRESRESLLANHVNIMVGNILAGHDLGSDMMPFVRFLENYLLDSTLEGRSMTIYERETGKLLYSYGPSYPNLPEELKFQSPHLNTDGTRTLQIFEPELSDGKDVFLYMQGISADGKILIHTFLPRDERVKRLIGIDTRYWLIAIFVGLAGSLAAWVLTAHSAKNITLLRDFAVRAASDREFIPMGDFPSDEIGDISRQIVAIYNARMQANVRRQREHEIALKAIEEKNTMKRALTNNISHELKTPIGIVRSYLEMILSNPDMSREEQTYFLQRAQSNVERLVTMMNDLSIMTRLEESKDNIPLSDIDFHELVFSLLDDFTTSGMLKDFDFHYTIPLDCHVWGNGELLIGVLSNLTKNAVAYSQGTDVGVKLIGRNNNFYTFCFYDNGNGVGEEHLPHLFERFYRIDKGRSRKVGGTGLGLPIVKSSINTMGGSIMVRNGRNGGLEFIFTLRRVKASDSAAPQADTEAGDTPIPGQDAPKASFDDAPQEGE